MYPKRLVTSLSPEAGALVHFEVACEQGAVKRDFARLAARHEHLDDGLGEGDNALPALNALEVEDALTTEIGRIDL